jgi:hypothetical protein
MGRAIPVTPLQGHEACNRVNFTFYLFIYVAVGGEWGPKISGSPESHVTSFVPAVILAVCKSYACTLIRLYIYEIILF